MGHVRSMLIQINKYIPIGKTELEVFTCIIVKQTSQKVLVILLIIVNSVGILLYS